METTLKPGDRVKQIKNASNDNPLAIITRIVGSHVYHIHEGSFDECSADINDFILVKVTDWRARMQNET